MHSDDETTATAPATSDSQPNSKRSNTYASLANSNLFDGALPRQGPPVHGMPSHGMPVHGMPTYSDLVFIR